MSNNVTVINRNKEPYERKWNGKPYRFMPDEAVTIPEEAAMHIFAYGKGDVERKRILVRNGWQKNGLPFDPFGPEKSLERLNNFVFKAAPADPERPKPQKKIVNGTIKSAREQTGINAVSPHLAETGGVVVPKTSGTLHLPVKGSKAPLAPPAA